MIANAIPISAISKQTIHSTHDMFAISIAFQIIQFHAIAHHSASNNYIINLTPSIPMPQPLMMTLGTNSHLHPEHIA